MSKAISLRGRVAALSRSRPADDADLIHARTDLAVQTIRDYIIDRLAGLPPLSASQISQLTELIADGGDRS